MAAGNGVLRQACPDAICVAVPMTGVESPAFLTLHLALGPTPFLYRQQVALLKRQAAIHMRRLRPQGGKQAIAWPRRRATSKNR